MICFRLQLTGDNTMEWTSLPIELDVDNETQPVIELDTPDLFKGSYTGELIYNVSFPKTEKNYRILGGMLSGSSYQLERKDYNIFAIYNGEILKVDKMYPIRNGFLNDDRFEVQLFNSQNWVKLASEKKINTIEVLEIPEPFFFQHSSITIDIVNGLGPKWEDIDNPIRFPFVTRTPLVDPSNLEYNFFVVESDLTPYVSLLRVLKKGFLEIGWKLEFPFLESDYGRRIWVDLCKDDFPQTTPRKPFLIENGFAYYMSSGSAAADRTLFRYPMFGNKKNFTIVGGVAVRTQNTTKFEESITPLINNGFYTENKFIEPIVADFELSMTIKRISPTAEVFQGTVWIYIMIGGVEVNQFPYYMAGGEYEFVNITLSELSINERDYLSIEIGLWPDINKKGFIQVTDIKLAETKLHRRFLNKTSIYKVQELFYEDSLLELLKGAAHICYGKVDVDSDYKIVRLLSPYDITLGEDDIEGYYKPDTLQLTNIQREEFIAEDIERKRYLHLSFQDSKEEIVNELYPDNEKQLAKYGLHGIFVDFGEKYEKEVESYKNTYFTPTLTPKNNWLRNAVAGYETGTYINKGRRIVFAIGEETIDSAITGGEGKFRFWSKTASKKNPFWAFQSFTEEDYVLPEITFMHLAFSTIKKYPDSIDVFPNLYDVFVKKYMLNLITSVSGTVWRYMSSQEFSLFDKRKQYYFNLKDNVTVCHITSIDGFRPCENQVVGMKFIVGDNFRADPITTSTPPENALPYREDLDFEIVVSRTDCSYFITFNFL